MPAHLKASLIGSLVTIPITHGGLNLGTMEVPGACFLHSTPPQGGVIDIYTYIKGYQLFLIIVKYELYFVWHKVVSL